MNHNKLITEELRLITNLMSYDRSKTLMEQKPESFMDRTLGITQRNADALGMDVRDYERAVFGGGDDVKWDHDTMGWVELALVGGGMLLTMTGFGAPLGLFLIGAGTVVGVTDAMVYYSEGDPYMGTMMLALNLIPGGELAGMLTKKAGAEITEQTIKQSEKAISKLKGGQLLTDAEQWAYEKFVKAFNAAAPEVIQVTAKKSIVIVRNTLKAVKLYKLVQVSAKIGKTVFKVGRIAVTVDQLWTLMATPESWRMKMRDKASFSKIMDMLYGGTLDDVLIDGLWGLWGKLWNQDGTENTVGREELTKIIVDANFSDADLESTQYVKAMEDQVSSNFSTHVHNLNNKWSQESAKVETQMANFEPVKFENLIKGLQTIRKGQKGDVVRDIQRMLVTIDYDLGNTGPQGDGVDGDFGEKTFEAIVDLQVDYNLEGIDGIVGEETSNKLYELYKEKKGL